MPNKTTYEANKELFKLQANQWEKDNPEKRRAIVKRYKRTLRGMILERYKEMRCRVEGKRPRGRHRYEGLSICDKEDFLNWSEVDLVLHMLYRGWVESNYDKRLSPSVDRIDPTQGYILSNIRWVTHSQNSSDGGKNKRGT